MLINLLATGVTHEILDAIPGRLVAPEQAASEVLRDPRTGAALRLKDHPLVPEPLELVSLSGESLDTFVSLVSGDLRFGLGDGEAATLAIAHHCGHVAVIDERKATRICKERFPKVTCISSVELLQRDEVIGCLGPSRYKQAIRDALLFARMRVPARHDGWVRELFGDECDQFPSLRNSDPV